MISCLNSSAPLGEQGDREHANAKAPGPGARRARRLEFEGR